MAIKFSLPTSLAEATARRVELATRVGDIQRQLGDRNRTKDEQRLPDHEYWTWRNKATYALQATQAELRAVNSYIKQANILARSSTMRDIGIDPDDPLAMLSACHRLLRRFAADLDDAGRAVVDATWECIRRESARRGASSPVSPPELDDLQAREGS